MRLKHVKEEMTSAKLDDWLQPREEKSRAKTPRERLEEWKKPLREICELDVTDGFVKFTFFEPGKRSEFCTFKTHEDVERIERDIIDEILGREQEPFTNC